MTQNLAVPFYKESDCNFPWVSTRKGTHISHGICPNTDSYSVPHTKQQLVDIDFTSLV